MRTISVIVPIYNAESYVAMCIESLIRQTYHALQIILVDDGSTDGSLAIAQAFERKDNRIKVLSQSNQGQASARNHGLMHATGDWISFVDADDYLEIDCYQRLIAYTVQQDVIHFGFRRVATDGTILYERLPKQHYRYTTPWIRIFRRQWLSEKRITFPEGMYYEDVVFTVDVWGHSPRQMIVPYVGYNYLCNKSSTTVTIHQKDREQLFSILREKLRRTSWRHKCIILYTIIRLKFHFMRYD